MYVDREKPPPPLSARAQAALATEFMQIIVRQAIDVGRLTQGAQLTPNRGIVNLDQLLTKCEWLLAGYPKVNLNMKMRMK